MKTAKQQAIEAAYGEHWDKVNNRKIKDRLSSDAWFTPPNFENRLWATIAFENDWDVMGTSVRPKSLQGIETNNGWQRIENEDDLPKDNFKIEFKMLLSSGRIEETTANRLIRNYRSGLATHFKPITPELKPIW